jgi:hypothetical protein
VGQRVLTINEGIKDLVVVRRGQVKELADGLFLGAGVLPPLPFQGENLLFPLAQRRVPELEVVQQRTAPQPVLQRCILP